VAETNQFKTHSSSETIVYLTQHFLKIDNQYLAQQLIKIIPNLIQSTHNHEIEHNLIQHQQNNHQSEQIVHHLDQSKVCEFVVAGGIFNEKQLFILHIQSV